MLRFIQDERVSRLCNGAGGCVNSTLSLLGSGLPTFGMSCWAQGFAQSANVLLRACASSISPTTHFRTSLRIRLLSFRRRPENEPLVASFEERPSSVLNQLDTGSPHPNPLPPAGEGTIALSPFGGELERGKRRCDEFLEVPFNFNYLRHFIGAVPQANFKAMRVL